jgi:uncharacterized protein (TIGR03086 family)
MHAEKSALLPITTDEAFALITEPERLRRWKTVSARVDLRAGGEYRFTVVPGNVAAGTYTVVEPGKRIVFGWGWEGSPDLAPDASTVTITIEPVEGGTLVRLVHDGLTAEQAASHMQGWIHFFERLERAAATGDAGPDEWAASPERLNPLSSADATLAVFQHVLRGLSDDDLGCVIPGCKVTVEQLAQHVVDTLVGLGVAAGGHMVAAGPDSVESQVASVAQQAVEAWTRRGLNGKVRLGAADVPAEVAVSLLPVEFLVHAWDVAAATGRQLTVSDDVSRYVLELAQRVIVPFVQEGGSFADATAIGPDADILERLIAFSAHAAP